MSSTPGKRACGSCTFCCKVMGVRELNKPIGKVCSHCKVGTGCKIYPTRPRECRTFDCGWLLSPDMPDEIRPDRSKVLFDLDETGFRFVARCDPANPLAWRNEPVRSMLRNAAIRFWDSDKTVYAMAGQRIWLIMPSGEQDLGCVDPRSTVSVAKRSGGRADVTISPP